MLLKGLLYLLPLALVANALVVETVRTSDNAVVVLTLYSPLQSTM